MTFRDFISVDLPKLDTLRALTDELIRTGAPLKLVDLHQVHLTLKFLGETEEALVSKIEETMRASVAGVTPFTVRLTGTGAFPNLRRMNVLWVGMVGGEPLVEVARRLDAGVEPLGFPREKRSLSPHVTIGRVKGGGGLDPLRRVVTDHAGDAFGEAYVDRIRLKKSVLTPQGPAYSTVEEVPLSGVPRWPVFR